MAILVSKGAMQRLDELSGRLEAAAIESQRLELLPPGLDQVESAGILGNEL